MLLRNRPPRIDDRPVNRKQGFEHLDESWITLLRWLKANRVEFVVVGAAAEAIRGASEARGPLGIVPAPYNRNFERLARALFAAHARLRLDDSSVGEPETLPTKLTAEKLARGQRWTLRCGSHNLDIEGRPPGVPRYQELLYEAARFELTPDLAIEVASPEDIENYSHVRKTGIAPEIRIVRKTQVEQS